MTLSGRAWELDAEIGSAEMDSSFESACLDFSFRDFFYHPEFARARFAVYLRMGIIGYREVMSQCVWS